MIKRSVTKMQLQSFLDSSKMNYKKEIIKQQTLKDAHIYCKINCISGQVSGLLIENYIKQKYNMTKNCASKCIGDLKYRETNIEIKVSNGGQNNNKFNYVQIRTNHDCEYLFTAYYVHSSNIDSLGELFIFRLTKNDIKPIILKYGGYAHGTVKKLGIITQTDLEDCDNKKEYALRPKYNDGCWNALLQFRIDKITI